MSKDIMNNNSIYEQQNKEKYSEEVLKRIHFVINLIRPFLVEGEISDVCCGNKAIGEILGANYFYDYYPIDEEVKFFDMLSDENDMVKVHNVLFFHAIEHFPNVYKTLKTLRDNALLNKGRLFIACPNAKYNNYHRPFDDTIGHYGYITPEYIQILAKNLNMRVIFCAELNVVEHYEEIIVILEKE